MKLFEGQNLCENTFNEKKKSKNPTLLHHKIAERTDSVCTECQSLSEGESEPLKRVENYWQWLKKESIRKRINDEYESAQMRLIGILHES